MDDSRDSRSAGVDPVFLGQHVPEGGSDLVTTLTGLEVNYRGSKS